MPLQNRFTSVKTSEALFNLIQILEAEPFRKMRNVDTTRVSRLINVYPASDSIFQPGIIRKILNYYWTNSYQKAILETMENFEKYLLALGKREHFIHQFEIMLLGLNILDLFRGRIADLKSRLYFDDWNDIFHVWTIASIGHDFGYPFECAQEILGKLSDLYKEIHMETLSNQLLHASKKPSIFDEEELLFYKKAPKEGDYITEIFCIKQFIDMKLKSYLNLNRDQFAELERKMLLDKVNHGYVSALLLLRVIMDSFLSDSSTSIEDFKNNKEMKMAELAAIAIASHNLPDPEYKNVSFAKNPYAFLLYILDNLHDWNRKIFDNMKEWPNFDLSAFIKKESSIELHYYLWDESWPTGMTERVNKSLIEKKDVIVNLPGKPDPPLSINIFVKYFFSESQSPLDIDIKL